MIKASNLLFIFFGLVSSLSSQAKYHATCGTKFNPKTTSFEEVKFKIASFQDNFEGINDQNTWSIGFSANTLMNPGTVDAYTIGKFVHFVNIHNQQPYAATKYIFGPLDLNSASSRAKVEVYELGGIVEFAKTATYECFEQLQD